MKEKAVLSHDAEEAFDGLFNLCTEHGEVLAQSKDGLQKRCFLKGIIAELDGDKRSIKHSDMEARESNNGRILFSLGNRSILLKIFQTEQFLIEKKKAKLEAKEKMEATMSRGELFRMKLKQKQMRA